jgi:hypothetical protein
VSVGYFIHYYFISLIQTFSAIKDRMAQQDKVAEIRRQEREEDRLERQEDRKLRSEELAIRREEAMNARLQAEALQKAIMAVLEMAAKK